MTPPDFLPSKEAAARLGIKPTTFNGLILAGKVQGFKFGSRYFVTPADLQEFIEKARVMPLPQRHPTQIDPEFFEKCTLFHPGAVVPASVLYAAYKDWSVSSPGAVLGRRAFGLALRRHVFIPGKSGGVRFWRGLRLLPDASHDFSSPGHLSLLK